MSRYGICRGHNDADIKCLAGSLAEAVQLKLNRLTLVAGEIIVLQPATNVIQMNYIHGSTNLCYRLHRCLTLISLSGLALNFVRFRPIGSDVRETNLKLTFVLSSFYVLEI